MGKAIDWHPIFADRTTLLGGVWHFRRDLIGRGMMSLSRGLLLKEGNSVAMLSKEMLCFDLF